MPEKEATGEITADSLIEIRRKNFEKTLQFMPIEMLLDYVPVERILSHLIKIDERQRILLRALRRKFTDVSDAIVALIEETTDSEQLDNWIDQAMDALCGGTSPRRLPSDWGRFWPGCH